MENTSKYFKTKELVSKKVYDEYGENAINFIDPEALLVLDNVREILNVPLICNDWARGGKYQYRGYREPECNIGAPRSLHKAGKAFDLVSRVLSAKSMREKLAENEDKLIRPIRVEKWQGDKEISWLHIDISDKTHGQKIYFFKA